MRFCFILEERYERKPMPMVLADQLKQWGHEIDVLQPYAAVTSLTDLSLTDYDALSAWCAIRPSQPLMPPRRACPSR
jgi:hypothetical protein